MQHCNILALTFMGTAARMPPSRTATESMLRLNTTTPPFPTPTTPHRQPPQKQATRLVRRCVAMWAGNEMRRYTNKSRPVSKQERPFATDGFQRTDRVAFPDVFIRFQQDSRERDAAERSGKGGRSGRRMPIDFPRALPKPGLGDQRGRASHATAAPAALRYIVSSKRASRRRTSLPFPSIAAGLVTTELPTHDNLPLRHIQFAAVSHPPIPPARESIDWLRGPPGPQQLRLGSHCTPHASIILGGAEHFNAAHSLAQGLLAVTQRLRVSLSS